MPKKQKEQKKISTTELKHQAFVLEFLKDFNATRSYKEVYKVGQKTAEANWSKLLGNTKVQSLIQKQVTKTLEKKELSAEWVLDNLVEIVNKCQQREPIKKTIKVMKLDDEGNETVEYQVVDAIGEFEHWGASVALDKLGKYLKLWTDAANLNLNVEILKVGKKK